MADIDMEAFRARIRAARLRKGEWLAALDGIEDPALRAVVDHHSRDPEDPWWRDKCPGCDQGCSCSSPEWPCSTITAILEAIGVDVTDIDLAEWRLET